MSLDLLVSTLYLYPQVTAVRENKAVQHQSTMNCDFLRHLGKEVPEIYIYVYDWDRCQHICKCLFLPAPSVCMAMGVRGRGYGVRVLVLSLLILGQSPKVSDSAL